MTDKCCGTCRHVLVHNGLPPCSDCAAGYTLWEAPAAEQQSPTWRPIAEMPEEWRDGRYVMVSNVDGIGDFEPFVARVVDDIWIDSGGYESCPTHYLDLAIPEITGEPLPAAPEVDRG